MTSIRQFVWRCVLTLGFLACPWVGIAPAESPAVSPTGEQLEFFEKEVRPLLAEHCYSCHSADSKKLQAGLRVDSLAAMLRGGDSGEAVVPGDVDGSLLIEAVRYESYEMPPKGKLPAEDIETLERWVEIGAPWPHEDAPEETATRPEFDLEQRSQDYWVWQPIRSPQPPEVKHDTWPRQSLDHFVLYRLEQAGLKPSTDADRSALLRRVCFDLIGLPPTPEQAERFLGDQSPQALQRLVDELLDSPHFGERWGRHWLDLVRYAESRGHEFDNDAPNAFQYRDYIIRALNADVPYDQLIREHIAGDLLERPRTNPDEGFNESILGTGFWFLGEWVHSPVDILKDESDRFDNMIDVMSKAFLGVTVSCARCHDHKFDAISTADYYSLTGFLQGSDYRQVRFESIEHNRKIADSLSAVDAKYQSSVEQLLVERQLAPEPVAPMKPELAAAIVFDYETLSADQFYQDGFLFGDRPRRAGQSIVAEKDDKPVIEFTSVSAAVSDPFWNGLQSVSETGMNNRSRLANLPRSGRTLRTPTFTLTDGNVACRVRGAGHVVACVDSHRLIAGPLHGETIKAIKATDDWVQLNLNRYVGHRLHLEFTPDENAQLEVSLITQGASKSDRQRLQQRQQSIAAGVEKMASQAREILADELSEIARLWSQERSQLQSQIMHRSRLAMAMLDGTGEDASVYIRGNSSKPGQIEPRHFLTAVSGDDPMEIRSGSGRRELAEHINDPGNPLTSRVIVNRIWHYLIGRGIVPTTDDFGVLGQRPTHPDLLDHLATQFRQDGQSLKRMIRRIVLSRTYQMSSLADPAAVAADPKNLLFHHRPPKRLEGEVIRDALLSISGALDPVQFGEPIPIHLTAFMDGRGRPGRSGPLDGARRRSIYTAVRRNFLSPFMLTFDTPVPFSTMGRRNVSNVPAQALILMNDPLVVQLAGQWADRARSLHSSSEPRIRWMYTSAFARQPTEQELAVAQAFLDSQRDARQVDPDDAELWSDFAHALINTKEFIFLR
ncbi:PSD1 and planctomycete cytochrome C domain-containing protein [Stieleria magnilauensis]|uniref:PSD1 and planctomycete cytochrome C domain-containing protein n=1 Tax=Stieleria magnilauensis TaxID=2527963 RepID=UPI003AF72FA6